MKIAAARTSYGLLSGQDIVYFQRIQKYVRCFRDAYVYYIAAANVNINIENIRGRALIIASPLIKFYFHKICTSDVHDSTRLACHLHTVKWQPCE